jgi:hypothetical protein
VDARGAPKRILTAHPADQFAGFLRDRRAAGLAEPDLPCPE